MRGFLLFVLILFGHIPVASHAAAIHDAAKKGDVAGIAAELDAGADINAIDGGATPLYFAARRGTLPRQSCSLNAVPTSTPRQIWVNP
jgi:cytochrome c